MTDSSLLYLADDDADYRYLVQQAFNFFLQKHRIRLFANGAELIKLIESSVPMPGNEPLAILLDIDMPQKDGFQTLMELKEHPLWKRFKVIMMTNRDHPEYRDESYRLGAHAFVLKPVSMQEIKKEMTDICEMQGRFSDLRVER
jgi:CheY-like chemotaxis protein